MNRITTFRVGVALVGGLSLLVACGDDSPAASEATTAAPAGSSVSSVEGQRPEDVIVDDATVAAGIATTAGHLAEGVTTPADAAGAWDEAHESWESYEGTVKKNDPDAYLAIEDALSAFKTAAAGGDTAAISKAVADFTTATGAYLAKYPG